MHKVIFHHYFKTNNYQMFILNKIKKIKQFKIVFNVFSLKEI